MLFQTFPVLETNRLRLIELSYEHIDDLFLMRNDSSMHKFTDTKPDLTYEDTHTYINKMIKGVNQNKWIIWAIEHKVSKKIIGTISIWNIVDNCAELGYGIIPDYQGYGYMQEALLVVLKFGFDNLGLTSLDAYTEVTNLRSINLLEKCKFKTIKEVIDKGYITNRDYQMICYRIQNIAIEMEKIYA